MTNYNTKKLHFCVDLAFSQYLNYNNLTLCCYKPIKYGSFNSMSNLKCLKESKENTHLYQYDI